MEALGEWALHRVGWLRYATFLQWQGMPLIEGQCVIIVWVVYWFSPPSPRESGSVLLIGPWMLPFSDFGWFVYMKKECQ